MDLQGYVEGMIELTGGGGGGSSVVVTPILTEGEKIAEISVDSEVSELFAPEPTEVTVTQTLQSGQKIGSISVDETSTDLFAPIPPQPTAVSVSQIVSEGEKIATITVDDVSTDLYAPAGGGYDISYDEIEIGTWIDGISKIYRKAYDANVTIPADGVVQLNPFISNRSDIKLVLECIGINTNVSDNRCENLYCWKDAGYIRAFSNFGITTNLIILEYIKNI